MIPIALFVYNRPLHTKRVLDALKGNEISLLYVFSDAPAGEDNNIFKVEEVRKIIDQIDWTEVRMLKQNTHKGLASSVIKGVSTVLNEYDKIIVLEDDCVPRLDFYNYMCQCLEHYEKQNKVFCVSAFSPPVDRTVFKGYPYDVFFWERFWSWGWGTWRRAWGGFNPDFEGLVNEIKKRNIDTSAFGKNLELNYLIKRMQKEDSWTIPFFLTMLLNRSICAYPVKTYVKNIGLDGSGIHCGTSNKYDVDFTEPVTKKELKFPPCIKNNKDIIREILHFIDNEPDLNIFQKVRRMFFK